MKDSPEFSEQAQRKKDSHQKVMWTVQECANYSGMSPGAIRRLIQEGRLPSVPVGVKRLVNRNVFLQLLEGNTQTPAAEPTELGVIHRVN